MIRHLSPAYGLVLFLLLSPELLLAGESQTGRQIYVKLCAECHGNAGQGNPDEEVGPLHGDMSVVGLATAITDTMPEQEPEACEGEDAEKVARYIFDTFYSAEAWGGLNPPRIELAHLTARQYRNSVADLLGSFTGSSQVDDQRGLSASYYDTRKFRSDNKIERIDPQVSFDFDEKTPDPKFENNEEFSMRWQGSIIADDTGDYEFVIRTENGAKLWVNDNRVPLIDAWVSSAGQNKEHRAVIRLLGGRAYPIRLDVFKYKEKTASISLQWTPPRKTLRVIPTRNLSPKNVPATFVVNTLFPPDDSVTGYERGTVVSQQWDQATTSAALEVVALVADQLDRLTRTDADSEDRDEKARQFCQQFAERAFRRPLTDSQQQFFIAAQFDGASDVTSGVKRSVLLVLKSPRFLYPTIERTDFDDYDTATRLALSFWDSLPDASLLKKAAQGELTTPDQVAAQSKRMLRDPRAKSKLRYFFHHWLQVDEKEGLTKDKELYPDFSDEVMADLRTSLDLFLDDVVWSEPSDFRQILLSDQLFLNQRLATFLGETAPEDTRFHKISVDPDQRSGIITHPYLLSTFAYFNLSSPVHRGVFVTRRLLGRSLKPPPQAIEFKDAGFDDSMTTRQKVALQTDPPACQACHRVINPLGFSLENFDAVGRFRKKEHDKAIDASATYTTVEGQEVQLSGARGLANFLANSQMAHGSFVDQIFHQAVKQPINAYGPTVRRDLIESFVDSEFNIQELLVSVAKVSALRPSKQASDVPPNPGQ